MCSFASEKSCMSNAGDTAQELEREINEMTTKQIELVNHLKLYRGQINNEGKHTASDALANAEVSHGVSRCDH